MEHLVFSLGKFGVKRKSQRKQHTGEELGLAESWEVCKRKEGRKGEREKGRWLGLQETLKDHEGVWASTHKPWERIQQ